MTGKGLREAEQRARLAALEAENFNLKFPVGTEGTLTRDDGSDQRVSTKYPAAVLCGIAVGYFNGISGAYMLSRFTPDRAVQP